MKDKKKSTRSRRGGRKPTTANAEPWLAEGILWLLILVVPLIFSVRSHDSFRLPKLLLSESLALASLVPLAWRLRAVERIDWRALARRPLIQAVVPIALVAIAGLAFTDHPLHVRGALVSLLVALICLVGWHLGLRRVELRRLLLGMTLPAVLLSVLVILQFYGVFQPFAFEGQVGRRIALTSLAGGPFDLATYLVLPILIAQGVLAARWLESGPRDRLGWVWAAALVLMLFAAALTQTLTVLIVVALSSVLLWSRLLPPRRLVPVMLALALLGGGAVAAVAPLRERVVEKTASVRAGDLNHFLTGRLDGWRAALWMLREHPVTGVGHGAYRAEFAAARLALGADGVEFYRRHRQAFFATAHSDLLESAASWGWPGVAAMVWAAFLLLRTTRRAVRGASDTPRGAAEAAVMTAAVVAFVVLIATNFALHLALVAYPFLLFWAAVFGRAWEVRP